MGIEEEFLQKIYGKTGPNTPELMDASLINKFFKYSMRAKQFVEILGVKHIQENTDAISVFEI